MKIVDIKNYENFLEEYIILCHLEWGEKVKNLDDYILNKKMSILTGDKVITILGMLENDKLVGFISLFKYDGEERRDLTPWYATMYVKKKFRGLGYSKILNDALLKKAKDIGYKKVYLKSNLINYYEKYGARYIEKLDNGKNLYYIDLSI